MRNTVSQTVHEVVEDTRLRSRILDIHPVANRIARHHGICIGGKGAQLVEQVLMMVGARAGVIMKIGSASTDIATSANSGTQPIGAAKAVRPTKRSGNTVADSNRHRDRHAPF